MSTLGALNQKRENRAIPPFVPTALEVASAIFEIHVVKSVHIEF